MSRGKLFYSDAAKGYTIKVIVDVLSGALPRGIIDLGKKGIRIRQMDINGHIMFDIEMPREKFREYKCRKEKHVSLNLKHLQKMVRNVKKKDSMVIFIDKKKPGKLGLSIRPEGSTAQRSSRIETVYIAIQDEDVLQPLALPEVHYSPQSGETKPVYGYPMVIGATDFQKIKKMATVGKEIVVKMQSNNYISFYSDSDVFSSELEFGSIIDDPESESDEEPDATESEGLSDEEEIVGSDSDASQSNSEDASQSDASQSDASQSNSEDASQSDSDESERVPQGWYEATFYTSMFSLLVKLPGLCSQMQFYAPRYGYPLKIKMDAGTGNSTLGTIQVYIKDIKWINVEQDSKNQGDFERAIKGGD